MKNNRWWIMAYACIAFAWAGHGQEAMGPERIELQRGSTRTLDFSLPIRGVESDTVRVATVDVLEGSRAIRIEAVGAGKAEVRIEFRDGSARQCEVIVPDDLDALLSHLRGQLQDIIGLDPIQPTTDRKQVVARGTIRTSEQWKSYRNVMDKLKPEWKTMANDLVVYKPAVNISLLKDVLGTVQGLLDSNVEYGEENGGPAIQIIGRAFSELTKNDAKARIEQELKKMKIEDVSVISRIALERCDFDIELIYFEMNQKMAEKVGVDLLNGLNLNLGFETSGTKGVSSWPWTVNAGVNTGKILEFMKDNNCVSTMSRQMVSVANGQMVKANLGGTITLRPQPTDGTATTAAREVPYGCAIQATPTLVGKRTIELKIEDSGSTEPKIYKSGQEDIVVSGISLTTTVNVEEGMQRTLNNVERRYQIRGRTGVPLLRDLPLIGHFFGKRNEEVVSQRAGLIAVIRARAADRTPVFAPLDDATDSVLEEIKKRLDSPGTKNP